MEKFTDFMITFFQDYSLKVVAAILIFIIGKWIAKRATKLIILLLEKKEVDVTLTRFLSNIIYYLFMMVILIAAVSRLGVNISSLLAIMGAAGLAVGLALKDSLSNFASGVMLILFRPFSAGQFIDLKAADISGTVKSIDVFNTILHTIDNKKVIIPNAKITNDVITNISANESRRIDLKVGISYKNNIAKVKEILKGLIDSDDRILEKPAPKVVVTKLAESRVNMSVRAWVKRPKYWSVMFDLNEKIKTTFDEEGISIPYSEQHVYIHSEKA